MPIPDEITPAMIEAALAVEWVSDFQHEFGLDDYPDQMAEHIRELWTAMRLAASIPTAGQTTP